MKTLTSTLLLVAALVPAALIACSSSDDSGGGTTVNTDGGTTVTTDSGLSTTAAHGLTLITAQGCSASDCHGSDFGGDIKQSTGNYSANITLGANGIGDWTLAQFTNAVENGIDDQGETLCSQMPKFKGELSDSDCSDIYDYLKTVPASDKVQPNTDCSGNPEGDDDASTSTDASTDH